MATIKQRIIDYLQRHPEGVDDDQIAAELGLSARQQANVRCRELEREGLVAGRPINGKLHNIWIGTNTANTAPIAIPAASKTAATRGTGHDDWFWEGNVQSKVAHYLAAHGFHVHSVADTATHETGKDIIAERDGRRLWVTVKGYPRGTERTNPTVQARHWFQGAVFDIVQYRGEDPDVDLAIALPDYPRYRKLAERIVWFRAAARFTYFWVRQDDTVDEE